MCCREANLLDLFTDAFLLGVKPCGQCKEEASKEYLLREKCKEEANRQKARLSDLFAGKIYKENRKM
jgi:hypothetical protein